MRRVLLADDQAVVRAGLRTILETDEAIEVVGEANDGQEAVTPTQPLDPDVVMMDHSNLRARKAGSQDHPPTGAGLSENGNVNRMPVLDLPRDDG